MKKTFRIAALALAALISFVLLCSCGNYSIIPEPSDAFYVYDEAGVLDAELEEYIVNKNADLYKKSGGQIVVACVKTTGTADIADYARDMFNKWGVGSKERNNGVLVLLSIGEDDYWVLQGKGLEDLLQSGTIKLLLDDKLEPYFAEKRYGEGVKALFDALILEFEQIYSIDVVQLPADEASAYIPGAAAAEETGESHGFWKVISDISEMIVGFSILLVLITFVIGSIIMVFIILVSVGSGETGSFRSLFRGWIYVNPHRYRSSGTYHGGGYSGGSYRSGGGFSGGSYRSSGGSSGGSHHSGGGGSSRGGGAGRR